MSRALNSLSPGILQSRHIGRIIWAGFALLFLATVLFSQARHPDSIDPPRQIGPIDAFSPEVIAAESLLHAGELHTLSEGEARRYEFPLKVRALTSAGPMTPEEMDQIIDLFEEYRFQIQHESDPRSRQTLRNFRNRQLFEALPRLDPLQGQKALDEIHRIYQEAFPPSSFETNSLPGE